MKHKMILVGKFVGLTVGGAIVQQLTSEGIDATPLGAVLPLPVKLGLSLALPLIGALLKQPPQLKKEQSN